MRRARSSIGSYDADSVRDDFDPTNPQSAEKDRGLHFLCYQSSIERGFQFLMSQWANSDSFPLGRGPDMSSAKTQARRDVRAFWRRWLANPGRLREPRGHHDRAAYLFSPHVPRSLSIWS